MITRRKFTLLAGSTAIGAAFGTKAMAERIVEQIFRSAEKRAVA